jgi:hypothetical protein
MSDKPHQIRYYVVPPQEKTLQQCASHGRAHVTCGWCVQIDPRWSEEQKQCYVEAYNKEKSKKNMKTETPTKRNHIAYRASRRLMALILAIRTRIIAVQVVLAGGNKLSGATTTHYRKQIGKLDAFLMEAKRLKAKIDLEKEPENGHDGVAGWQGLARGVMVPEKARPGTFGPKVFRAALLLSRTIHK